MGYNETNWEPRENLALTDAFKEFVTGYGNGKNVGEPNTSNYTESRRKLYMRPVETKNNKR